MTLQELYNDLQESYWMVLGYFESPDQRLNWIYLSSSSLLAIYVYFRSSQKEQFLKSVFGKTIWFSSSAFTDYFLLFFNSFLKVVLIGPYLIYGFYLAFETSEYLPRIFGLTSWQIDKMWIILSYTFVITLANDFVTYLLHYLMHTNSFLWEFHKVHHSATVLNPVTQYRIHPVELVLNNVGKTLVFGFVTGLFDYLSDYHIHPFTFLGANVFSFLFLIWGSNLRHSHVRLTYFNWLEYILISPFQHQIHHSNSRKQFNKNMGSKLAVWDWLFGTLMRSNQVTELSIGLGEEDKDYNNFSKNLWMPFWKIFRNK